MSNYDVKKEAKLTNGKYSKSVRTVREYWTKPAVDWKVRTSYKPGSETPLAISRSRMSQFLSCPRCFYYQAKYGFRPPGGPPFLINSQIDALAKKEMDYIRKSDQYDCHPVFAENNLNIKPYIPDNPTDLNHWRDDMSNFIGLTHLYDKYNFMLCGIIDDVMINDKNELIVVDFKATAKGGDIQSMENIGYGAYYKIQLEWYSWLFKQNGFPVSNTGYLIYWNGDKTQEYLAKDKNSDTCLMNFKRTLVPVDCDLSWIEPVIQEMYECIESDSAPEIEYNGKKIRCQQCAYLNTYLDIKNEDNS